MTPDQHRQLAAGQLLGGRYTLGTAIAAGGMGDVWEATDEVLGRPVAIKVMRPHGPDDDLFLPRFRDEARHTASLQHPNIAAVYDYGEEDGIAYLVMELVPGLTLAEVIRDSGGLEPEQVRSIIGQAALALSAAHEAGVVHRDVKPANIIITPEGQAKLTDFGIARAGNGSGHTLTGEVLGTPDYISPEQALGQEATRASDIYALGVVAHEMLTGTKPFDMGTPVATALAQVNDTAPPLPDTVPLDLRTTIEACLAKAPEERPSDASVVAEALGMPLGSLPGVTPPSDTAPTQALPILPPDASGGADATRTLSVLASTPTPAWATRGGLAAERQRVSRQRRRVVMVVGGVVAVLTAGAFVLGSMISGPKQAAGTGTPTRPPATSGAVDPSTASTPPTTSTRSTSSPTTSTPVATSSATKVTTTPVPPGPARGKGKGKKR